MTTKILVMGLPGAGKTTLAQALREHIWQAGRTCAWYNADVVRQQFDDWDFSTEGRIRQSQRMRQLADAATTDYVIVDFVAPLQEMRDNFAADITIWVDTITEGRYTDTNAIFEKPAHYDFRVMVQNAELQSELIAKRILGDTND